MGGRAIVHMAALERLRLRNPAFVNMRASSETETDSKTCDQAGVGKLPGRDHRAAFRVCYVRRPPKKAEHPNDSGTYIFFGASVPLHRLLDWPRPDFQRVKSGTIRDSFEMTGSIAQNQMCVLCGKKGAGEHAFPG